MRLAAGDGCAYGVHSETAAAAPIAPSAVMKSRLRMVIVTPRKLCGSIAHL